MRLIARTARIFSSSPESRAYASGSMVVSSLRIALHSREIFLNDVFSVNLPPNSLAAGGGIAYPLTFLVALAPDLS